MKKIPVAFLKFGLRQDQRMTDVLIRELLPRLESYGFPIQPTIVTLPWREFTIEKFTPAKLERTGYADAWRIFPQEIIQNVPADVKFSFAIFQRDSLYADKPFVSHADLSNRFSQVFWLDGTFEDNLENRIWIFLHEFAHWLYFATGTPDDLHSRENTPEWLKAVYTSKIPKEKAPFVEYPAQPGYVAGIGNVAFRLPLDNWTTLPRGYRFGEHTFYSDFHLGIDLIVPEGTPIFMPADGAWQFIPDTPQGGNIAICRFADISMRALHLSRFNERLMGRRGEVLAYSGNTGLSRGPHVHIDLYRGSPVNVDDLKNFIDPDAFFAGSDPVMLRYLKNIAAIRRVFGSAWSPAPRFVDTGLVWKGIVGAVRVAGSRDPNRVYLLGDGGYPVATSFEFLRLFRTLNQSGIVGTITPEQAVMLGIIGPESRPL